MGDIPMSMLSYATVGNGDGGDDDEEVDIEQFREGCWRRISTAYSQGGGIAELAEDLEGDDEGEGDKNTIKVSVRTRPVNDREIRLGTRGCIEHLADGRNIIVRKFNWKEEPYDMTFAFDFAFDDASTQDQVTKMHRFLSLCDEAHFMSFSRPFRKPNAKLDLRCFLLTLLAYIQSCNPRALPFSIVPVMPPNFL